MKKKHEMDAMKKGGKVKKHKKEMKTEGKAMKMHMGKPMKKADGGQVLDSTNSGVTPSSPMAIGSPQRKSGGKC